MYLSLCKQQCHFTSPLLLHYRLLLGLLRFIGSCHHGNTSKAVRYSPLSLMLPSANLTFGIYLEASSTHIPPYAELLQLLQPARLCILPSAGPKVIDYMIYFGIEHCTQSELCVNYLTVFTTNPPVIGRFAG